MAPAESTALTDYIIRSKLNYCEKSVISPSVRWMGSLN